MDPIAPEVPGSPPSPRRWIWLAAAVPAVIAVVHLGRYHPDEVYQALEPAYWRAHGYGILAWEWQVGLRNWALPGFFGLLLSACKALGIDHPRAYRAVLELPQYLLHAWALFAAYRYLARRTRGEPTFAAFFAVALYGPILAYGGRTLGEAISTAFLLVAIEALDRTPEEPRNGLLGGGALGMAVVVRYPSAVLVLAALAWLVLKRRWRTVYYAVLAGAAVAAGLAVLDWLTWGAPFHSLRQYLEFNVLSGRAAAQFGAEPWYWYLPRLLGLMPAWVLIALPFAVMKPADRLVLPLFAAVVYLVVVSATAHKEVRFLYPALVLLTLASAPGLPRAWELVHAPRRRRVAIGAAIALSILPVFFHRDARGDQFWAIIRATRPSDARGLLIVGDGVWGSGGYFYIGKNIPWTVADFPHDGSYQAAMRNPAFNRVVTYDRRAEEDLLRHGFAVTDRIGRATVMAR